MPTTASILEGKNNSPIAETNRSKMVSVMMFLRFIPALLKNKYAVLHSLSKENEIHGIQLTVAGMPPTSLTMSVTSVPSGFMTKIPSVL
jgi:hypothetical protein